MLEYLMCSICGEVVKLDDGVPLSLERYTHPDAYFTMLLCPTCVAELAEILAETNAIAANAARALRAAKLYGESEPKSLTIAALKDEQAQQDRRQLRQRFGILDGGVLGGPIDDEED